MSRLRTESIFGIHSRIEGSNADIIPIDEIILSGSLYKQGREQKKSAVGGRRNWKRRWIELGATCLNYYDESNLNLKGSIPIQEIEGVVWRLTKRNAIRLMLSNNRSLILRGESDEEIKPWYCCLSRIAQRLLDRVGGGEDEDVSFLKETSSSSSLSSTAGAGGANASNNNNSSGGGGNNSAAAAAAAGVAASAAVTSSRGSIKRTSGEESLFNYDFIGGGGGSGNGGNFSFGDIESRDRSVLAICGHDLSFLPKDNCSLSTANIGDHVEYLAEDDHGYRQISVGDVSDLVNSRFFIWTALTPSYSLNTPAAHLVYKSLDALQLPFVGRFPLLGPAGTTPTDESEVRHPPCVPTDSEDVSIVVADPNFSSDQATSAVWFLLSCGSESDYFRMSAEVEIDVDVGNSALKSLDPSVLLSPFSSAAFSSSKNASQQIRLRFRKVDATQRLFLVVLAIAGPPRNNNPGGGGGGGSSANNNNNNSNTSSLFTSKVVGWTAIPLFSSECVLAQNEISTSSFRSVTDDGISDQKIAATLCAAAKNPPPFAASFRCSLSCRIGDTLIFATPSSSTWTPSPAPSSPTAKSLENLSKRNSTELFVNTGDRDAAVKDIAMFSLSKRDPRDAKDTYECVPYGLDGTQHEIFIFPERLNGAGFDSSSIMIKARVFDDDSSLEVDGLPLFFPNNDRSKFGRVCSVKGVLQKSIAFTDYFHSKLPSQLTPSSHLLLSFHSPQSPWTTLGVVTYPLLTSDGRLNHSPSRIELPVITNFKNAGYLSSGSGGKGVLSLRILFRSAFRPWDQKLMSLLTPSPNMREIMTASPSQLVHFLPSIIHILLERPSLDSLVHLFILFKMAEGGCGPTPVQEAAAFGLHCVIRPAVNASFAILELLPTVYEQLKSRFSEDTAEDLFVKYLWVLLGASIRAARIASARLAAVWEDSASDECVEALPQVARFVADRCRVAPDGKCAVQLATMFCEYIVGLRSLIPVETRARLLVQFAFLAHEKLEENSGLQKRCFSATSCGADSDSDDDVLGLGSGKDSGDADAGVASRLRSISSPVVVGDSNSPAAASPGSASSNAAPVVARRTTLFARVTSIGKSSSSSSSSGTKATAGRVGKWVHPADCHRCDPPQVPPAEEVECHRLDAVAVALSYVCLQDPELLAVSTKIELEKADDEAAEQRRKSLGSVGSSNKKSPHHHHHHHHHSSHNHSHGEGNIDEEAQDEITALHNQHPSSQSFQIPFLPALMTKELLCEVTPHQPLRPLSLAAFLRILLISNVQEPSAYAASNHVGGAFAFFPALTSVWQQIILAEKARIAAVARTITKLEWGIKDIREQLDQPRSDEKKRRNANILMRQELLLSKLKQFKSRIEYLSLTSSRAAAAACLVVSGCCSDSLVQSLVSFSPLIRGGGIFMFFLDCLSINSGASSGTDSDWGVTTLLKLMETFLIVNDSTNPAIALREAWRPLLKILQCPSTKYASQVLSLLRRVLLPSPSSARLTENCVRLVIREGYGGLWRDLLTVLLFLVQRSPAAASATTSSSSSSPASAADSAAALDEATKFQAACWEFIRDLCLPLAEKGAEELARVSRERATMSSLSLQEAEAKALGPNGEPRGASEEIAVRMLSADALSSTSYKNDFFLTYRSFMEPETLLRLLVVDFTAFASKAKLFVEEDSASSSQFSSIQRLDSLSLSELDTATSTTIVEGVDDVFKSSRSGSIGVVDDDNGNSGNNQQQQQPLNLSRRASNMSSTSTPPIEDEENKGEDEGDTVIVERSDANNNNERKNSNNEVGNGEEDKVNDQDAVEKRRDSKTITTTIAIDESSSSTSGVNSRKLSSTRPVSASGLARFSSAALAVVDSVQEGRVARSRVLRTTNAIKFWIESHFKDFTDALIAELIVAVQQYIQPHDATMSKMLLTALGKALRGAEIGHTFTVEPPEELRPKTGGFIWAKELAFMEWPALEVARQLTLIDNDLFRRIRIHEFLDNGWSKKNKEEVAPNILAQIARFNFVSKWVALSIVRETNLEQRRIVLGRFVEICSACVDLNNFNTSLAILSGLGNSAVHRLKQTWAELPESLMTKKQTIDVLLHPEKSYKNLRERMSSVTPPCMPYLGMFLTDLTFVADGNPTRLADGSVNLVKGKLTANVIGKVALYQQVRYNLRPISVLIKMLLPPTGGAEAMETDDQLYQRSLVCEPRT